MLSVEVSKSKPQWQRALYPTELNNDGVISLCHPYIQLTLFRFRKLFLPSHV